MKKNGFVKFVLGFVFLGILVFVSIQVYRNTQTPLRTELAGYYKAYDSIDTSGLVLREERIIESGESGVKTYMVEDGGRVGKGGVVIEVFSDEEAAKTKARIAVLDEEINALSEVTKLSDSYVLHTDTLGAQMNGKLSELRRIVDRQTMTALEAAKKEYANFMNKYRIGMGREENYNERVTQLKAEKQTLEGRKADSKKITASEAGYFVSEADGYEGLVEFKDIPALDYDALTALKGQAKTVPPNSVGKLVTGYDWYLVCELDEASVKKISEGTAMSILLPFAVNEELDCTVAALNHSPGKKSTAVLRCSNMYKELSLIREQHVRLILKKYEGLQISKKAIRFQDGERGVYVVSKQKIIFKKIDVIYTESSYVICSTDPSKESSLWLYDEVVVEGKDLYEGKVVTP